MSLNEEYDKNISRLVRFLSRDNETGYAFVYAENQILIPQINNEILSVLEQNGQHGLILFLDANSELSILEQMRQAIAKTPCSALIIANLYASILDAKRGKAFLTELNFSREALYHFDIPILFWISKKSLTVLSNQAVDLFTQRRISTIHFSKKALADGALKAVENRFTDTYKSSDDYKRLDTELALLKKQLGTALQNPTYTRTRIAADFALPYALKLAKLNLGYEAEAVIADFEADFDLDSPDILRGLADIHSEAKNTEDAIFFFEKYIDIQTYNYLNSDKSEKIGIELRVALSELGKLFQSLGNFQKALNIFEKYNEIAKELYHNNPNSENIKNGLAISYSKLGDIHQAQGNFEKALVYFEKETVLFEALYAANPRSESLKNGLAVSYSNLGDIHQAQGNFEKALVYFEKQNVLSKELYQSNPQNAGLQFGLATSYLFLGWNCEQSGKKDIALPYYQKALPLLETLCATTPIPQYINQLKWVRDRLSEK